MKTFREKMVEGYYQTKLPWGESADPDWLALRQAHARDQFKLEREFKLDMLKELGLEGDAEIDLIYSMACELTRCSGLLGQVPIFLNFKRLLMVRALEGFLKEAHH